MVYQPRIESSVYGSFITTRSRNSELWFINNQKLEEVILGYVAKFRERYSVLIYALAIEGNHIHIDAKFPLMNRASFMRDLNSCIARAVDRHTPEYPGGRFWGRRYSSEILPDNPDIEEEFFYTAEQPIRDGLVEKLSMYPAYTFLSDAIHGIKRKYTVVNWTKFNDAKRWKKNVKIEDYIEEYTLEYERLPGYEELSQQEYAKLMREKFEQRRKEIVRERFEKNLGFAGKQNILKTPRGARPKRTKTSTITDFRPRVLCKCPSRYAEVIDEYFIILYAFKEASRLYRNGDTSVKFPPGTYKPTSLVPQKE